MQKVSGDEYTRQAQSVCYNMELSCNETVVLVLNLISGRFMVTWSFFMTSILAKNG